MAQRFPNQQPKVIAKPVAHTRDLKHVEAVKDKPSPHSTSAGTSSTTETPAAGPSPATTSATMPSTAKPKTKADKLYDIHVRKVKMAAKPLDPTQSTMAGDEKRYFETSFRCVEQAIVDEFMAKGSTTGVSRERVWVPSVRSPVGPNSETDHRQCRLERCTI